MDTFKNAPHFHLTYVDSTNNYASKLLKLPNTKNKTAITADLQLEGRGQRGNIWSSEPNQNFLGTFIIATQLEPNSIFMLSKWTAICVVQVLNKYQIPLCQIKWPNDIYIGYAKTGGILIENQWQGNQLIASLVGIGVNILQSPQDQNQITTHAQLHTNQQLSPHTFLTDLQEKFDELWHLLKPNFFAEIDMLYQNELWGKNEVMLNWQFPDSNNTFKASIIQVHRDGGIELELENKVRKKYYHGEIFKK